ncbi:MAG: hypothetical protein K6B13_03515 [Prevotella sp.]|nr:hypothetical protein [Prevotella sp.]
MKRLYTLLLLALTVTMTASAQWNTNATPVCIYPAPAGSDYYACNPKFVRTPDKKTWIAWHTWGKKNIKGIDRDAVCIYLQLLDRDGVPQFEEPIQVNDHATDSWWSEHALQVAADGSAIVTVADGRAEENDMDDEQTHAHHFSPAIYKIDQEGNFLWGLDGVEYPQYRDAAFTNAYVVGEDTYFIFYNTSEDGSGIAEDMTNIGTFIQRINDDGTAAWEQPRKWSDSFIQPQIVPSTDGEFLLFDKSPSGSLVHRLNRDLEEVWGEPVTYDENKYDGYAMNAYSLVPDGQGGAVSCFVRNMGGFTHNIRVQHINADGSLGFGLSGLDAANTEDNDYDYCSISVNPKTEEILVDFESQLSTSYDVMLQKFSYDGDYLFDELGLSIASKDLSNAFAFGLVGTGALENGDWIVAYRDVQAYGANTSFVIRRYSADGQRLWTKTIGRNLDPGKITFIVEDEVAYLYYRESSGNKNPGITIFRIASDGSYNVDYGQTEPDAITTVAASEPATESYYSLDGKPMQQPQKGLTLVRRADGTISKMLR